MGQAWSVLGEAMLAVSDHLLVLCVPEHCFQDGSGPGSPQVQRWSSPAFSFLGLVFFPFQKPRAMFPFFSVTREFAWPPWLFKHSLASFFTSKVSWAVVLWEGAKENCLLLGRGLRQVPPNKSTHPLWSDHTCPTYLKSLGSLTAAFQCLRRLQLNIRVGRNH